MASKRTQRGADLKVISEEHPEFIGRIAEFFSRNRDTVGYLVIGIIIVVAVVFLMDMNSRAKEEEASVLLQSAIKQYQQDLTASSISFSTQTEEDAENAPEIVIQAKAAGIFQSVFDNYPGTDAGENALYMVGISQLNQGDYEQAITTFESYIAKFPNSYMTASGKLGKATAEFNFGNKEQSLATLQNIEKNHPNFYLMDVVTYEQAKRYEALDNFGEARVKYQTIIDQYPDSQWKTMSEQALDRLDKEHSEADNESA
ncbi:tetratricopeptide repeat protein [bacterium]|nr:tetratricopeptide repeat protein [bacterium]